MEINKFDDVLGVVPTADIVEGRFVCLDSQTMTSDFGSRADLPGAHVPATAEQAKRARYCITFALDNRQTPIFQPTPAMNYALRGGFDQAANSPFATTVYLTNPGNMEGLTIPSGQPSIAFTVATVTLPSGSYVYDANIVVPGAAIIVEYSGVDAGKPKYTATDAVGVIGVTERYDSTLNRLTIRIE